MIVKRGRVKRHLLSHEIRLIFCEFSSSFTSSIQLFNVEICASQGGYMSESGVVHAITAPFSTRPANWLHRRVPERKAEVRRVRG